MTPPKTHCPFCNSLQRFAPKTRVFDNGSAEVYIVCKTCRRKMVIEQLTPDQVKSRSRNAHRRKALARMRLR
jgi:hypothetical protein